jgi:uncharacterized protein YecE (DUF72 family)
VFTAAFAYLRFLGNRKEMDAAVKQAQDAGARQRPWESLIKDRTGQMKAWIPPIKDLLRSGVSVYVYFNNHYAGYAPGSVELFAKLLNDDGANQ